MKTFVNLMAVFVAMPIWYFLMYSVLKATHQDRLVWFLFWVYIPFSVFINLATKVLEDKK